MTLDPSSSPHVSQTSIWSRMSQILEKGMLGIIDRDDGYYRGRLDRGVVLEQYEIAIVNYALRSIDRDSAHVFEIGAGWGLMCITLAALGFRVTAFNGEGLHCAAMQHLIEAVAQEFPVIRQTLDIRKGFFPYSATIDDVDAGRHPILIGTNIINESNVNSQDAILATALHFDRVLIDVATFARDRDVAEQSALRALIDCGFAELEDIWQGRLLAFRPRPDRASWSRTRPPLPSWLEGRLQVETHEGSFAFFGDDRSLFRRADRCWALPLPESFAVWCDDASSPTRSPFRLIENDTLLGPPHALHADIEEIGCGRYSHWEGYLLFSTSDGSDPRRNGYSYRLCTAVLS